MWPTLAGASELAAALHQEYPVVTVGVISPYVGSPSGRIDDWAAARTGRLLATPLVIPPGGGKEYGSSLGEVAVAEDRRQVTIKLRDDLTWAVPPRKLTGQDVARSLLAAADPQDAHYDASWAAVFGGVNVRGGEVLIDLVRPSRRRKRGWCGRCGGKVDRRLTDPSSSIAAPATWAASCANRVTLPRPASKWRKSSSGRFPIRTRRSRRCGGARSP